MGVISGDEFEPEAPTFDSPPPSPTPAAARAQAISHGFSSSFSDLNAEIARDYAWMCCEEFSLTDVDREDVVQASQMHYHLVAVRSYARIMALARDVQRMIIESFLNSTEFKDHITRRVQATFLDPSIPAYVCGSTDRLVKHMQLHSTSWHIPPVVQANFLHTKAFFKAIVAVGSNFRGDMHRKLKKSIAQKSDIVTLVGQLCIKGYQPEREHLKRFALLRGYHEDWLNLPNVRGKRQISFWEFIDSKLEKLRTVCIRNTKAETQAATKHKLKLALENDKQKFPGKFDLPSKVSLSGWQKDTHAAVRAMSTYQIDTPTHDNDNDPSPEAVAHPAPEAGSHSNNAEEHEGEGEGDGGDEGDDEGEGEVQGQEHSEGDPDYSPAEEPEESTALNSIEDASIRVQVGGPSSDIQNTTAPAEPPTPPTPHDNVGSSAARQNWTGGSLVDRTKKKFRQPAVSPSPISSSTRGKVAARSK